MFNMIFNTYFKKNRTRGKKIEEEKKYSGTSRYGHLSNTDTSLLRTVSNVSTKLSYIFFKKTSIIRTLSNTDNGH